MALFSSILANKLGRRFMITELTGLMASGLLLISFAPSGFVFILIRILTGAVTGGIVPISIAVIADLYPLEQRGKYFSWFVLALAGGMTFGPTFGACLYPEIGWRIQFIVLVAICGMLFIWLNYQFRSFSIEKKHAALRLDTLYRKCRMLLKNHAGKKIYCFIFLNGVFHSGMFVWISYYFSTAYHFDDRSMGLGLLLFSLPGLLMAVSITTAIARYGSYKVIFAGLFVITLTIGLMAVQAPFWVSMLATGFLSIGYVMTQPFFVGIINSFRNGKTSIITIGFGACLLFMGYGLGPVIFLYLLKFGIGRALILLTILEICLGLLSWKPVKIKPAESRHLSVK
jgi:predicted MFS family arabinose efflux permease